MHKDLGSTHSIKFGHFCHFACVLVLGLIGFQGSSIAQSMPETNAATPDASIANSPSSHALPALLGPKRSVAVGKFDSIGSFGNQYGDWDIGGGLAAMLATSLQQSGQFIVLERAYAVQMMNEQQLKKGGMLKPGTEPQTGQMLGAQFLIYGSVTEFGTHDSGGGLNLGFGGMSPFSAGLSNKSVKGAVAFDLRIVDASSGQVVQTATEREEISSSGLSVSGGYNGMTLGGDQFNSTPLGAATRHAIDHAVADIINVAAKVPWKGQVVDTEGKSVIINAGSKSGVKLGDRFFIEHPLKQLTDPTTGEVLSERRQRLGSVQVDAVEEKISSGMFVPIAPYIPARGDVVIQELQQ